MIKRLYRNKQNKMIGGVASGMADYFEVDPVLVRALFIIITIAYGIGLLAYIVLWIIIPSNEIEEQYNFNSHNDNPNTFSSVEDESYYNDINISNKKNDRKFLSGIILILSGIIIFIKQVLPDFNFEYIVPIILIIVGFSILYKRNFFSNKGE